MTAYRQAMENSLTTATNYLAASRQLLVEQQGATQMSRRWVHVLGPLRKQLMPESIR